MKVNYGEVKKRRKNKLNKEIREWAIKESPPAYLVLLLDEDQYSEGKDFDHIARIFCNHWSSVKEYIEKRNAEQGKSTRYNFLIECPDKDYKEKFSKEFYYILDTIYMYLQKAERYKEAVDFCNDMIELFDNDSDEESNWIGVIGETLWMKNAKEGEAFFKEHLKTRNDIIMGYYTYYLLDDERWEDAAEALKGYEDSEDEAIQERFEWLNERE